MFALAESGYSPADERLLVLSTVGDFRQKLLNFFALLLICLRFCCVLRWLRKLGIKGLVCLVLLLVFWASAAVGLRYQII